MPAETERLIVLTGGPGAGKTTLIEHLRQEGYATADEGARAIIQDQRAIDGPALPWRDRALFAELMLSWDLRSYRAAEGHDGPVFFDRAIPEIVGYLRAEGLPVPDHVEVAARRYRYHTQVFLAPPWPEIYRQDEERRQSYPTAVRVHELSEAIYREYGYETVDLPLASVEERARFVTARTVPRRPAAGHRADPGGAP